MAQLYVVCLMETRNASNRRAIGYRSFWLCHSGPYPDLGAASAAASEIPGAFGVAWRGAHYYCVDAIPVEKKDLDIYGLARKTAPLQVLLPTLELVR